MKYKNISSTTLNLNEIGNIVYNGIDLKITPNQLFDVRTQLGITSKDAMERQYQLVMQKRRCDNFEILLD